MKNQNATSHAVYYYTCTAMDDETEYAEDLIIS